MKQSKSTSKYPLWMRVLAIVMAGLTASGVLTYIVLFLINLFSK